MRSEYPKLSVLQRDLIHYTIYSGHLIFSTYNKTKELQES